MAKNAIEKKGSKNLHSNKQNNNLTKSIARQKDIADTNANLSISNEEEATLIKIFLLIRKQCNMDFNDYKKNTIIRSIDKRMKSIQIEDLSTYFLFLQQHSEEVDLLCKSFLIAVTRFFRDKEAFEIVSKKIIPNICMNKKNDDTIRLWVVGCSTGEEAYSLAILLKEYMNLEGKFFDVKIFATDVDNAAVEYARTGIYTESIEKDVPQKYLSKYFLKINDAYHVVRQIRDMVVFSYHNIIHNPPFSRIDFLSCRNLMIYFQPSLQKRVLSLFQYSLNQKGFLFLGTSETVNKSNNALKVYDGKWKIYERNDAGKQPFIDNISVNSDEITKKIKIPNNIFLKREEKFNFDIEEIHRKLIEEYVPSSVIIDNTNEIVQVCGDANKYIKISSEKASLDILKMVPKSLSTAITTALPRVKKEKIPIRYKGLKVQLKDKVEYLNLIIKPFGTCQNDLLTIIIFEEIQENKALLEEYSEEIVSLSLENKYNERIVNLEQELNFTRDELQNTIDEVATASEELQSSNEELLVSNEELHSTNEELQSVNEELVIVNNQYQYTIQELTELNNDMSNFLNSTEIGTLFLDNNFCVRRFTPAITKEINLIEQDIGRPIAHISHNFINHDLISDAKKIIGGSKSIQKELQSKSGCWYISKYSPYRVQENEIKGVVISLVDFTELKKSEEALKKAKERFEQLVECSPFAIITVKKGIINFVNIAGVKLLEVDNINELLGKPIRNYFSEYKNEIYVEDKFISLFDSRTVNVELTSIPIGADGEDISLLVVRDISSKKHAERLQLDVEKSIRLLNEKIEFDIMKTDFFSNISHEIRTPLNVIVCSIQLLDTYLRNKDVIDDVKWIAKQSTIMRQNCYRLIRLVNNVIDITKLDSGYLKLCLQNCNIVHIVEEITLSVSEYIEFKSIQLVFDTDVEEKYLACDLDMIERIILNLLSNAVKYTQRGGRITVNVYDKGESISISVKDTGIGIPEDKLDIIFQRFGQVDTSFSKEYEGSGIGLSLVNFFIEMHGGKISVLSEVGVGSEFIVELPVKTVDEVENKEDCTDEKTYSNVEKIKIEFSEIYKS